MTDKGFLDPRKETDSSGRPQLRMRDIFYRNRVIFEEGSQGDHAYYIENGRVEVSVRSGKHKVVVSELGPGEIFGEMALLSQEKRSATVTALEDTTVTVISQAELQKRLGKMSDAVIRSLIFVLTDRLTKANQGQARQYEQLADLQDRFLGLNTLLTAQFGDADRDAMRQEMRPILDQLEAVINKYAQKATAGRTG